jgi:DNA-binding LytR/AlgR family response regulator
MKSWCFIAIEDSISDLNILKEALSLVPFYELEVCKSINEAISLLKKKTFDILFLDIALSNDDNGLDLIKFVPEKLPIIVISSHPQFAINTYEHKNVVDFLQKPYTCERFLRAIKRAINVNFTDTSISDKSTVYLKTGRKMSKIEVAEILYIQAFGIYSKVFCKCGVILVNEAFSTLIDTKLPLESFRRVQKSYIINLNNITGFDQNNFYFGTQKIPIGRTYKEGLEPLLKLIG